MKWLTRAEKYFPHLIAGRGEDGLLDLLSEGVKPEPDVMDEDVVELAMSMAGPGFFASHDQGETFEDADSTNWDNVPFSWLAAKGQVEAIRYQIRMFPDRYAGKDQMTFNWDEAAHPRETKTHDGKKPGEFAPKAKKEPPEDS